MSSLLVSAALTALMSASAAGQPDARPLGGDIDRFIGREVRIIDAQGIEWRGRLSAAGAGELRLLVPAGEVAVAYTNVKRLDRRGDSVKEGLLIGMLWPIVMLPLGAGQGFDSEREAWAALPLGVAMMGAIGAGVDALNKGWTTLYRADRPRRSAFHIMPGRRGVRVSYVTRF